MNINRFYRVLVLSLSLFSTQAKSLPEILDYYPNCSYPQLETISEKYHIDASSDVNEQIALQTPILLNSLQVKAKDLNASSLVLISKTVKQNGWLTISAELITACDDLTLNKDRPAKLNHLGEESVHIVYFKPITIKTQVKSKKNEGQLYQPKINDLLVSFNEGVYGIKLGSSYQQVRNKLGDPSIELFLLKDEFVVGYGRNHWFHFQSEKLVKIDTETSLLTLNSLNRIPLRDHFDDQVWKINNKVGMKARPQDIFTELGVLEPLVNNKIKIVKNEQVMFLNFWINVHPYTQETTYTLGGFTLQNKSYTPSSLINVTESEKHFQLIDDVYKNLKKEQAIELELLQKELGEYSAKIILNQNEEIVIYNPHLFIQSKDGNLEKIHFSDGLIKLDKKNQIATKPWSVDGVHQGQSYSESKKYISKDNYEMENYIQIDFDNHYIVLFYEKIAGVKSVYEFDINFY